MATGSIITSGQDTWVVRDRRLFKSYENHTTRLAGARQGVVTECGCGRLYLYPNRPTADCMWTCVPAELDWLVDGDGDF